MPIVRFNEGDYVIVVDGNGVDVPTGTIVQIRGHAPYSHNPAELTYEVNVAYPHGVGRMWLRDFRLEYFEGKVCPICNRAVDGCTCNKPAMDD